MTAELHQGRSVWRAGIRREAARRPPRDQLGRVLELLQQADDCNRTWAGKLFLVFLAVLGLLALALALGGAS